MLIIDLLIGMTGGFIAISIARKTCGPMGLLMTLVVSMAGALVLGFLLKFFGLR